MQARAENRDKEDIRAKARPAEEVRIVARAGRWQIIPEKCSENGQKPHVPQPSEGISRRRRRLRRFSTIASKCPRSTSLNRTANAWPGPPDRKLIPSPWRRAAAKVRNLPHWCAWSRRIRRLRAPQPV